jgi:probable HAF family extracellular repeat protein
MRNTSAISFTSCKSLITLLLCLVISQQLAAQTSYTVTDVASVNDLLDVAAGAAGMNNAGAVVGQALLSSGPDRAFLWIRGTVLDLGTLGGPDSSSHAINSLGQVVGAADTAEDLEHAFLWNKGTMLDLGTLGGLSSEANSVNAQAEIVGFAATTTPDPTFTTGPQESHAFLWADGAMKDLFTLGGPNSIAIDINGRGQIVGWSQTDFNVGAFGIPDLHPATWTNGVITRLDDLGGAVSLAIAVNDQGVAVGQSFVAGNAAFHAVQWQNGNLNDLGTLAGDFASIANDINSQGQVVGASVSDTFSPRAFVWQNSVMTDLNTLIPADSGWILLSASHINDMGQIAGNGFLNGVLHAFLLTPSFDGGRTGSTKPSSAISLSETTRQWLIWGKSGLLKHKSGQFKSD